LTALALASNKANAKPAGKTQRNALNRLRRKSVKKTEAVSVKKISLFDDQRGEFDPEHWGQSNWPSTV